MGLEEGVRKYLREMRTSWEDVKRDALNRFGRRRSMRSYVDLRLFCAAVS